VTSQTNQKWIKTLVRFLNGTVDENTLLANALIGGDPPARDRQCEAYYYAGMARLLKDDTAGAKGLFEKCMAINRTTFYEHAFAKAELARMTVGRPPATP
jgi:lipoprotein NlpI